MYLYVWLYVKALQEILIGQDNGLDVDVILQL